MDKKIEELIVRSDDSVLTVLKSMDSLNRKLLIVYKNKKYFSLISIGDIQRAILNNVSLDEDIESILRSVISVGYQFESKKVIKSKMVKLRAEFMPILNDKEELVDLLFWEDIFDGEVKRKYKKIDLPVVIMAGGKGTRLKPLTNVIPKPLIPIGDNTIIEEIMNHFVHVGCNNFYLSVNYKAETIKHYFEQLNSSEYKIDYFQEEKPLGTIGSLFLLKDKIDSTFFVSNCDIIIDDDYLEILKYHNENKNEITIVSALKHYPIPYGIIETKQDGLLKELKEKPELTFQINSGLYILEPHLLNEIPENEFFHITHLIENIVKRKGKIGVFPVSEGSWIDIGTWEEYLNHNKFRK